MFLEGEESYQPDHCHGHPAQGLVHRFAPVLLAQQIRAEHLNCQCSSVRVQQPERHGTLFELRPCATVKWHGAYVTIFGIQVISMHDFVHLRSARSLQIVTGTSPLDISLEQLKWTAENRQIGKVSSNEQLNTEKCRNRIPNYLDCRSEQIGCQTVCTPVLLAWRSWHSACCPWLPSLWHYEGNEAVHTLQAALPGNSRQPLPCMCQTSMTSMCHGSQCAV